MALKLRRGISANRTNIVPAEGELIYTTDTKVIYVGDGSTPGGNVVTSSGGGGSEITGITDNTTGPVMTLNDTDITLGQDLILGGNIDITNHQIDGDGDINISGDITASGLGTGIITANSFVGDGSALTGIVSTGPFVGDLTGSVFADDSTRIIDGTDATIFANSITVPVISSSTNTISLGNSSAATSSKVMLDSVDESSILTLLRSSADDLTGQDTINYGTIQFGREDANGFTYTGNIISRENALLFASTSTGDFATAANYLAWKEQKLGIGTITPTEALDVVGNANVSGTLTADTIVSNAAGTPELSSATGIVITAVNNFEVDAANMQIDETDVKLKLDLQIEGVEMLGRVASNDATAFIPAVVSSPILSSIAGTDTLDGTDRVKEVLRYDYDRYTSGGEILIAINDYGTSTGADQFLVKKFLFHDSAGDGSAFVVTEIGSGGNAGLFTSLTVASVEDAGNFFLTFTLRSPDAAITGASMLVTGQTTFTSNPLAVSVSGY